METTTFTATDNPHPPQTGPLDTSDDYIYVIVRENYK